MPSSIVAGFGVLTEALLHASREHYGNRLVSLAVFGSVGRGTPRPDSDMDVLIVAERLPQGRVARADEFRAVESALRPRLEAARGAGVTTALSPVFKTPEEIQRGSPLLLDMTEDARVVYDPAGTLRGALDALKARLAARGARRIWQGSAWIWDLKPDYRPGEEFEL